MRERDKTVITVETVQRTTIRRRRTATIALCERCAAVIGEGTAAHTVEPETSLLPPQVTGLSDIEAEEELLAHPPK